MRTITEIEDDLDQNRRARLGAQLQLTGVILRLWEDCIEHQVGRLFDRTDASLHDALMQAQKLRHDLYPIVHNLQARENRTAELVAEWKAVKSADTAGRLH